MGDKATQSDSEKDNGKSHTPALQGGQEINAGPIPVPIGERRPDLVPRAQRGQISPGEILHLQRAIGNQAVERLMRRAAQSKEAEPQEPLSHQTATIQPKLTVEVPDGPYEQEADHVAQQVMRMPTPPAQVIDLTSGGVKNSKEEMAQTKPPIATTPIAPRSLSDSSGSFEPGPYFESRLSTKGNGSPLSASTRAFMEPRFGSDFGGVRLHTGSESAQLNRAVSAQAFTHGSDIYLGEGKEDVESDAGKQLLAHELTHTIQQGAAGTTDLARQRMPASIQRDPTDSPETLDQQYNTAVQAGKWVDAAEKLNGFNRIDILGRLANLTPDQITSLHKGAVDNPRIGPESNVAQMTAPGTPRASTLPPTASVAPSSAETLDQQYQAHLAAPRWDDAARALNGFSDDDIRKRVERLGWNQLEPMKEASDRVNGEASPRIRGPILSRQYRQAVGEHQWPDAAMYLNGFDDAGITNRVTELDQPGRTELYLGAVRGLSGKSLARILGPIEKGDLNAAYGAVLRLADWAKAAEYLNGLSDADISARVAALSADGQASMLAALAPWAHRVRAALLDAGYRAALAVGDWDGAARNLNGFDDTGINERVQSVRLDALEPIIEGASRANGAAAVRIRTPALDRLYRSAVADGFWMAAARYLNDMSAGEIETRLGNLVTGQLQALKEGATQQNLAGLLERILPHLSQALSGAGGLHDVKPDPDQPGMWQLHIERQSPQYIDNVATSVMVGIYLPGYLLQCHGTDLPIVIPWDYVQFSGVPLASVDESVYGSRSAAEAAVNQQGGAKDFFAYYRAAGGFSAPTTFSWATTPNIVRMISQALAQLKFEVQQELTVLAIEMAGAPVLFKVVGRISRPFNVKEIPPGVIREALPGDPELVLGAGGARGSVGSMRLPRYQVGPANPVKPGLRVPSAEIGQEALENSLQIGSDIGRTRRIGISHPTREFVDFVETEPDSFTFRGTVRRWNELPPEAQNALKQAGHVKPSGEIVAGERWTEVTKSGEVVTGADLFVVTARQARFNNFQRTVKPNELRGAPPPEGSKTPGHARAKHKVSNEEQADVLNNPDRIFNGIYERTGNEVDIYCKGTDCVFTDPGDKASIKSAYSEDPSKWANDPEYVEIRIKGSNDIIYHSRQDWDLDFWPFWKSREHLKPGKGGK